jgi:hypothetical protein
MGAAEDFSSTGFRRLVVNATYWALGVESEITPTLNVDLVGEYHPSHFSFDGFIKGRKPGQAAFAEHCVGCHGANLHPTGKTADQLRQIVQNGYPASGMPGFKLAPSEMDELVAYLGSLSSGTKASELTQRRVVWGPPTSGDWLTYNGQMSANRYSELKDINTSNVADLKLKWIFPIPAYGLEVTPLEADGVIYTTGPNQVFALDATSGEQIWHYGRPKTAGLSGDASLGLIAAWPFLTMKCFLSLTTRTCWPWIVQRERLSGTKRLRMSRNIMAEPSLR